MRKVKIFSIFTSIILLCSTLSFGTTASAAFTPRVDIHSEGVYMVELETNTVVVAKNENERLMPASTTKIMTALVALENITDFDKTVDIGYEATNEFWDGDPNYTGPSHAALEAGQTNVTYWDCLYSLMVASACDSANVLALNIAGNIPAFVEMMNKKADEIGCTNTHFANTHGLYTEDNYTSAKDLYLITRYAMENYPGFMKICDTKYYDMPANSNNPGGYTLSTTNQLMLDGEYYYEGVHGIKTGSINKYYKKKNGEWDSENPLLGTMALVSTATAKGSDGRGYHYILVTLGAPYYDADGNPSHYSFKDHIALYDWAYSELVYTNVVATNEQIAQADVHQGKNIDKVGVCAADDFSTLLEKSLNKTTVSRQINWIEERLPVQAPQNKGYEVGELQLMLDGEVISTIPLTIEKDIEIDSMAFYMDKIKQVMANPLFGWTCVLIGLEIVMLIVSHYIKASYRRKVADMNRRRRISMSPPKKSKRR